jgi:hypothetical protein
MRSCGGGHCLRVIAGSFSYQSQSVQSISQALSLEEHPKLVHLGDLLLCEVASVAILLLGSLGREVVVVVLGVHIHGDGGVVFVYERRRGRKDERDRSAERVSGTGRGLRGEDGRWREGVLEDEVKGVSFVFKSSALRSVINGLSFGLP